MARRRSPDARRASATMSPRREPDALPVDAVPMARKRSHPGAPRRARRQSGRVLRPDRLARRLRRVGRARASAEPAPFPDAWRTRADIPIPSPARVAVVLHVHYPELVDDDPRPAPRSIPVPFDLIVTNSSGAADHHRPGARCRARAPSSCSTSRTAAATSCRSSRLVNAGLLDPYHLILKVHTKRSAWREDHADLPGTGAAWRDRLLGDLLGDAANVRAILDAFATTPDLGLVTGDGSLLGAEFWGDNQAVTANLLRRLELDLRPDELAFAAGSMYWIRGFVLQGLRALNLTAVDFEAEAGQVNATTAHAVERVIGIVAARGRPDRDGAVGSSRRPRPASRSTGRGSIPARRSVRERGSSPSTCPSSIRSNRTTGGGAGGSPSGATSRPPVPSTSAIISPSCRPTRASTTSASRRRSACRPRLARDAGIAGFMYYHYWFAGQELLEGPIRSRLTGDVDLPFCLMWANENWTRRWDGRESDVLMGQRYEEVPAAAFIEDVLPILRDPRYLRIDGRPIARHLPARPDPRRRAGDRGLACGRPTRRDRRALRDERRRRQGFRRRRPCDRRRLGPGRQPGLPAPQRPVGLAAASARRSGRRGSAATS